MEEIKKDETRSVRCSVKYEEMENGFSRYQFAVPTEDLFEGYGLSNGSYFECNINDELKVIHVVALEANQIVKIDFEDVGEMLCSVYVFVGMNPMTPEEAEKFQKEMEERQKEFEEEQEREQEEMEAAKEQVEMSAPEDAEFEEFEVELDLTKKKEK
jgi:hypothetical protein